MTRNKKARWVGTLLVTASAGLLLGSMAYFAPKAEAGRGGSSIVASTGLLLGSMAYFVPVTEAGIGRNDSVANVGCYWEAWPTSNPRPTPKEEEVGEEAELVGAEAEVEGAA